MGKKVKKQKADLYFVDEFAAQIDYLEKSKSPFTADNYRNVYRSFCKFVGKRVDKLKVKDITYSLINAYITHIETSKKVSSNSLNSYYRVLRAVYNKAVNTYSIPITGNHPFAGIHISVSTTLKRSLMQDKVLQLIKYKPDKEEYKKALHLFLFLFYARGMCFIDAFNLRYDQINDDYIRYKRSKTAVPLLVKIEKEMRDIMNLYREEGSPYVFPFLHRNQYTGKEISEKSSLRRINRQLGELGKLLGVKLTTYVARHSWASMIQECGGDLSVISQGMGHTSELVTKTYLKGLPSHVIDNANSEMLNCFFRAIPGKRKKKCLVLSKEETFAT